MKQSAVVLGALMAVSALAVAGERSARACGGCFHPPTQTVTDITDEKMLLSVSTTQTTLYDQILYQGSPSSFAWVLPIHGTVTVGLSADVLFNSVDVLTATQITPPPSSCAPCSPPRGVPAFAGAASVGASADAAAADLVTVTRQENVGPYETVQLQSSDPTALSDWLTQNGYNIPADVQPVVAEYVNEGFDFLAMKLLPNQGVQEMRPVRVTSAGASLSLPLRMASVGTGAVVGITIWVVADGRYEPQNYPFFHIDDADLVWDYSTNLSNYTTLRVEDEAKLMNGGWEIESSLTLNQQVVTNVVLAGGQYYPGSGGFGLAPSDPSLDYLPVDAPDGGPDAAAAETAEEVRTDDLNTLFAGITAPNVRVTRIRSDIAHAAMTADLVLQASADQSELSNLRIVTQSVNEVCACGYLDSGTVQASGGDSGLGGGGPGGGGQDATLAGGGYDGSGGGGSDGSAGSSGQEGADASSAQGAAAAVANGNQGPATGGGGAKGCAAAPASNGGDFSGLGVFGALLGLAFARSLRARPLVKPAPRA
jgi:hypothetical protein